jgi:hypothetical protein
LENKVNAEISAPQVHKVFKDRKGTKESAVNKV